MKTTAAQKTVLAAATMTGSIKVDSKATGNAFAALARAGLMTHSADGAAEPGFDAWVIGSIVYITAAGRAAL